MIDSKQTTQISILEMLARAEIDYRDALLEYDKAEEEGVSSFHEHNTCSYLKGVIDAYRNLLDQNQNNDRYQYSSYRKPHQQYDRGT
jgi:hypothetical protein